VVPRLAEAIAPSTEPAIRLSLYPDALLDELEATSGDTAAAYDLRESVQLAFLAAVHVLPPRQRAVLILHDVAGFSAGEVAEVLEATLASVHSALTRTRATLAQQRAAGRLPTGRSVPTDEVARSLVPRYGEAWQAVDMGKRVGLLKAVAHSSRAHSLCRCIVAPERSRKRVQRLSTVAAAATGLLTPPRV
jgi:RNA polymerase sigma-70 factor (ECF subfamily)